MNQKTSPGLIEEFIACLSEKLGSETYEVTPGRVEKLTGSYDSVLIMNKDTGVGANIDRRLIIGRHENGESVEQIADAVRDTVQNDAFSVPVRPDWIMQYDKIRELLFVRLSNRERNAQMLSYIPHKNLPGDLAATVHIYVDVENGFGSIIVTQEALKEYGMSFDELYDQALENSQKLLPASVNTLNGVLDLPECADECTGLVLTNRKQMNGAAVILYPGILEEAGEYFGEDFWLFPSSIHEMVAFRTSSMTSGTAYDILRNANRTVVDDNEWLSDTLYHFSIASGTLTPAEEAES